MRSTTLLSFLSATLVAAGPSFKLRTYVDALPLNFTFDPIQASYWTGLPHHRRTPLAISPNGLTGFLAYLDNTYNAVHVQHFDPQTMQPLGWLVTIPNVKEVGGIVAFNQGFALLGKEPIAAGTPNSPPNQTPVAAIYRYKLGVQQWKTYLGGPDIRLPDDSYLASPDLNGDLAYSAKAGLFGAYFVVSGYGGPDPGHFGDSIQYVNHEGARQDIKGATSTWGCSHNTGIAFEAADSAPFASICSEDQGAIWLNTATQGMGNNGVKISNEHVINGGSGEPMGGMSGSYSSLARFVNSSSYIFTWVSRGAVDLTANEWMGNGYTHAASRTNGRRVAVSIMSDKNTKLGPQASSQVGAADGDSQVDWITPGIGPDRSNAHVAVFDDQYALVGWEEIASPACNFDAMGCSGKFSGTYLQLVDKTGAAIGEPSVYKDLYISGDMVTLNNGTVCWPYVHMDWKLDGPVGGPEGSGVTANSMSFACVDLVGS